MSESINHPPSQQRILAGITGLDAILGGGLFVGSHFLIIGPPGAGKTIMANQLCFQHIATGGHAIYISLLAETNSRLLTHLQHLTFFTPAPIGDTLYYCKVLITISQLEGCSYTALVEKSFDLDEVLKTLSHLLNGKSPS